MFSQISSVSYLVLILLCVGRGTLTVGGVVPKLGVLGRSKNIAGH